MKFINDNSISKHKIKRRYRLSFQSENTLNELWSVKLTRGKVFIALAVIIAAITTLISTIIVSTPLRTFLPGYLKSEQRTENIVNAFRLDSLEKAVAANEAYISNIRNIITGNIPDTSVRDTSAVHYPTDSLIPQSQREKEFISQYDERERFNLSVLTPIAAEGLVFAAPVQGKITEENEDATTIHIVAPRNAPVCAIYNGTVISCAKTAKGTTIIIQHPSGFISIYGNLAATFIERGAKVASSQAIATAPADGSVIFELWHDGIPAAPRRFIAF